MIKAVIFDLDGTLLDTIEDLADSMNIVLEKYGYPTHPVDSYKYFVGDGVREFTSRALPAHLRSDEKLAIKIGTEAMEEYSKRWHNKTKPYEGVIELLENLSTRKIKKAILSNKPHDFTLLTTAHFFGEKTFDEILGEKPTFRRKLFIWATPQPIWKQPAPQAYIPLVPYGVLEVPMNSLNQAQKPSLTHLLNY